MKNKKEILKELKIYNFLDDPIQFKKNYKEFPKPLGMWQKGVDYGWQQALKWVLQKS